MDNFEKQLKQKLDQGANEFELRPAQLHDLLDKVKENAQTAAPGFWQGKTAVMRGNVGAAVGASISVLALVAIIVVALVINLMPAAPYTYGSVSDITATQIAITEAEITDYVEASFLPSAALGLNFVEAKVYMNEDIAAAIEVCYMKVFPLSDEFNTYYTIVIVLHESFEYSLEIMIMTNAESYYVNGTEVKSVSIYNAGEDPVECRKFYCRNKLIYCSGEGMEAEIIGDIAAEILS